MPRLRQTPARRLVLLAAAGVPALIVACSAEKAPTGSSADSSVQLSAAPASPPPPAVQSSEREQKLMARGVMGATAGAVADVAQVSTPPAKDLATTTMLIRTGDASIQVDSLEVGIAAVQRMAAALGGVVGNSSLSTGDFHVRSATLEVRIPATRFNEALETLRPIGKLESVSSNAQDVGEEFVDVSARLSNAKRLEERLVTLLANRTGKLEDVLAVERELARVREEIERYEGRVRYLQARVATSTLTITLHEKMPIVTDNPGQSIIGEAFKNAWRNFVRFVAAFISSLGVLIPVAAIGFVVWVVVRRFLPRPTPTP